MKNGDWKLSFDGSIYYYDTKEDCIEELMFLLKCRDIDIKRFLFKGKFIPKKDMINYLTNSKLKQELYIDIHELLEVSNLGHINFKVDCLCEEDDEHCFFKQDIICNDYSK